MNVNNDFDGPVIFIFIMDNNERSLMSDHTICDADSLVYFYQSTRILKIEPGHLLETPIGIKNGPAGNG